MPVNSKPCKRTAKRGGGGLTAGWPARPVVDLVVVVRCLVDRPEKSFCCANTTLQNVDSHLSAGLNFRRAWPPSPVTLTRRYEMGH